MSKEAADDIAHALGDTRLKEMRQDRVGEGLVTWDGQARPGDLMAVAVAAGGSIRVDGTGERCEVPVTGPAWARVNWTIASASRATAQGWSLTADDRIE